ncbi:MAG: prolyl hydroxylase family protein [Hyphomonadaceae bacterium]
MIDGDARLARVLALLRSNKPVNELFVAPEVEAIANAGSAPAALLAATIAALGFGRAQSWSDALAWLAYAAERGETAARAQLRLLSSEAGDSWRAMAAAVDVAAWIAARPREMVIDSPRIGMAHGFIDPPLCAWLVSRARPMQGDARVYAATADGRSSEARTNSEASFTMADLDLPLLLLRARIANTMGTPASHLERVSVFRYLVGQTFAPHVDFIEAATSLLAEDIARRGQRVATFLIYLNAEFEAGETHFLELGRKLRGAPGDAVFFYNVDEAGRPDPRTRHEGAAPTSGEKWLLSQFIRDREQAPS